MGVSRQAPASNIHSGISVLRVSRSGVNPQRTDLSSLADPREMNPNHEAKPRMPAIANLCRLGTMVFRCSLVQPAATTHCARLPFASQLRSAITSTPRRQTGVTYRRPRLGYRPLATEYVPSRRLRVASLAGTFLTRGPSARQIERRHGVKDIRMAPRGIRKQV